MLNVRWKPVIMLTAAIVLSSSLPAQTNIPPLLYLHFGIGYGESALRLLTTGVVTDQRLFVAGSEYLQLEGRLKQSTNGILAELIGSTGQQSGFYKGPLPFEKPMFAQGGAASGGATAMWFTVSTNSDCKAILERIKAMGKQIP